MSTIIGNRPLGWKFIKENKKTITRPRKRSRKQENRNKVRKQELDQERDHQSH